jgi:hypothetical protein
MKHKSINERKKIVMTPKHWQAKNQLTTLKEMKEKWIKSDKFGNDIHLLNATNFLGSHHEQRFAVVGT